MQNQINNAFAKLNVTMLERQVAWAMGRKAKVVAYRASEQYKIDRTQKWGSSITCSHEIDLCGGKGWYGIIASGSEKGIAVAVEANVNASIARRDAQIIKALTKIGVTTIPEFELVEVSDGVEGFFDVAGHRVTIRTILAGGYNIQCLHTRTLVKIK